VSRCKDWELSKSYDIQSGGARYGCLECARIAPSAGNRQPWVFIVVKDPEIKKRLVEASGNQTFLAQAPVVIVVCGDPEISGARYEDRGRSLYVVQDTAAATMRPWYLLGGGFQRILGEADFKPAFESTPLRSHPNWISRPRAWPEELKAF